MGLFLGAMNDVDLWMKIAMKGLERIIKKKTKRRFERTSFPMSPSRHSTENFTEIIMSPRSTSVTTTPPILLLQGSIENSIFLK